MNAPPVLAARGVSKAFAGVAALTAVDFDVRAGEVVALVGENGAGKSTLLRALSGELQPDAGDVLLDGRPVQFAGPADAYAAGIARVAQEPQQCASLSVAAAVFLGAELRRGWMLCDQAMAQRTGELLRELGLHLDPRTTVGALAAGQRQLVEIARALRAQARVLILDEPTSSLTHAESERLFEIVDRLRDRGTAIVYVTHRMAEITRLADRVVVLRDGRNSGAMTAAEASHERIVAAMVGRQLHATQRTAVTPGEAVFEVRELATAAFPAARVGLRLRAGEVVGVAGLLGAGRSELLRALVGLDRRRHGEVLVAGVRLRGLGPAEAAAAGLVLVPEDRQHEGLLLAQSVLENVSLPTLRRRGRLVDAARERALAAHWQQELGVRAASLDLPVAALSGGNQQKVAIARWLAAAPKVLLLDEPTRGVDVGARAEIYARLDGLARAGLAVLFVSSDLEEVLALADRVLVLHQGAIAGELAGAARTEDSIMMLATGGRSAEGA